MLIKVIGKDPHEGVWYEIRLQDGQEPVINGDELTIKGAQLCRVDPTGRS